jgi:hypothetical protein
LQYLVRVVVVSIDANGVDLTTDVAQLNVLAGVGGKVEDDVISLTVGNVLAVVLEFPHGVLPSK